MVILRGILSISKRAKVKRMPVSIQACAIPADYASEVKLNVDVIIYVLDECFFHLDWNPTNLDPAVMGALGVCSKVTKEIVVTRGSQVTKFIRK